MVVNIRFSHIMKHDSSVQKFDGAAADLTKPNQTKPNQTNQPNQPHPYTPISNKQQTKTTKQQKKYGKTTVFLVWSVVVLFVLGLFKCCHLVTVTDSVSIPSCQFDSYTN